MRLATSHGNVAAVWRTRYQKLNAAGAPLVVMTNEAKASYLRRLAQAVPSVVLGGVQPEIIHAQRTLHDNYLAFQTLRFVAAAASVRIGTTGCYLVGGCDYLLVTACA